MILSLFSVFDPYVGVYVWNWSSRVICLLFIPQVYWLFKSRLINLFYILLFNLWLEVKVVVARKFNNNNLLIFIVLFLYILVNNFIGLFPYIFTRSSHLMFSLIFSLSIWLGLMGFGWIKNTQFIFAHLVPLGTPPLLIFFMVLIETLRNIIRPLTLSIRLVANMIAGHLLLTLLRRFIPEIIILYIVVLIVQILLLLLEIAVSVIQSYVFIILIILYLKETNYDKI